MDSWTFGASPLESWKGRLSSFVSRENLALGSIHKQRRQFFQIFGTPSLMSVSFLVLSVGNFDQFLTLSPLPIADVVYEWPHR